MDNIVQRKEFRFKHGRRQDLSYHFISEEIAQWLRMFASLSEDIGMRYNTVFQVLHTPDNNRQAGTYINNQI